MAGLSITGQMKVSTLQERFSKEFGLTLRIYDGRSFADPTQTLAEVRKKKGSGEGLSVAKNMKVGNLEDKFEEEFGLKVQVAGSNDSYLCKDDLTLAQALTKDAKRVGRQAKKTAQGGDRAAKRSSGEEIEWSISFREVESGEERSYFNLRWAAEEACEKGDKEGAKIVYQQAAAKAADAMELAGLGDSVCEHLEDNEWGRRLYQQAEGKAADSDDFQILANDSVLKHLQDRDWAKTLYEQAAAKAADASELTEVGDSVCEHLEDKDWGRRLYQQAEGKAADSDDFQNLADSICAHLEDKDWAKTLYQQAKV